MNVIRQVIFCALYLFHAVNIRAQNNMYFYINIKKIFLIKNLKKTMIELFDITQDRFKMLSDMGYNIIYRWDSSDDFIYDNKLEY